MIFLHLDYLHRRAWFSEAGSRSRNSRSARRLRERGEYPRPRADALVKTLAVVFFARRMSLVVVERQSHQQGIDPERALEIGDDRSRAARAHRLSFLAPPHRQRALSG